MLPAQGPIGVFVHHNTLHAFQHLRFHDAIAAASELYDAQGYLSEDRYREALASGRIEARDLEHALALRAGEAPDRTLGPLSLRELERLALVHGIDAESPAGLRWTLAERGGGPTLRPDVPTEARLAIVSRTASWLERMGDDETRSLDAKLAPVTNVREVAKILRDDPERAAAECLWAACRALAPAPADPRGEALIERVGHDRTHRDLLVALDAPDPARRTNDVLVRFLEAYLDEGMARWPMPHRERGLLACFVEHGSALPLALPAFERRALARLRGRRADEIVPSILDELEVAPGWWDAYLTRVLLEQPGWSGMIARLESSVDDRRPGVPSTRPTSTSTSARSSARSRTTRARPRTPSRRSRASRSSSASTIAKRASAATSRSWIRAT